MADFEDHLFGRPPFHPGERVLIKDGMFFGRQGEVREVLGRERFLRVELTIFGRTIPVELEYEQVEPT